jgi:hypothetical protein
LWLLDEDMSFVGFDFDGFRTVLTLGFAGGKPMLAQPVLWRRDAKDPSKYELIMHDLMSLLARPA